MDEILELEKKVLCMLEEMEQLKNSMPMCDGEDETKE